MKGTDKKVTIAYNNTATVLFKCLWHTQPLGVGGVDDLENSFDIPKSSVWKSKLIPQIAKNAFTIISMFTIH